MRGWALWQVVRSGVLFLIGLEALAVALVAIAVSIETPDHDVLVRSALLLVLGVGYGELADRIERLRRFLNADQVWSDRESVWTFAAALTLPAGYAGVVVIVLYGSALVRAGRHRALRPYRHVFTGATVVIATVGTAALTRWLLGGRELLDGPTGALVTALALVVYTGLGLLLMLIGTRLAGATPSLRAALPEPGQVGTELGTLLIGTVTAVCIIAAPWFAPVLLVLAGVVHRASLVHQLQMQARGDTKTALLNWPAWRELAATQLGRLGPMNGSAAVLMLDLDEFKSVNDRFGHQVGDLVLREVGDCLRSELRGHDAVARYGGEEFVALLCGVSDLGAIEIADRLRRQVAALCVQGAQVTVSVGVAIYPAHGLDAERLVTAADLALYRAKAAGRNRVTTADDSAQMQELS